MFTFYLWLKALKDGSALFGALTALFYFYMVAAWGGFAFITNMLPIHAFTLLCMGRYTSRLYVAYSTWYAVGTLSAMQVPFVGFQPLRSSEHMAALGVFGLLQLVAFAELVRGLVSGKQFRVLLRAALVISAAIGTGAIVLLTKKGWIAPWTGRFYSLFDTGYAKIHIPIVRLNPFCRVYCSDMFLPQIASVSEHQPTAWPSFFFDLNLLIWLFPAGVILCFRSLREEHLFIIIYSIVAAYFAGVMVRLMLTLTPVVCLSAAMVVSRLFETYLDPILPGSSSTPAVPVEGKEEKEDGSNGVPEAPLATPVKPSKKKATSATSTESYTAPLASTSSAKTPGIYGIDLRLSIIAFFTSLLVIFVFHCTWVTSSAYSSPSVVLASRSPDGSQNIIDDFREAYYWLRRNTAEDAKVMSWWDYGCKLRALPFLSEKSA
jgi:dolichyl-diphosphooligosaccharide--protein glycosyltransferase